MRDLPVTCPVTAASTDGAKGVRHAIQCGVSTAVWGAGSSAVARLGPDGAAVLRGRDAVRHTARHIGNDRDVRRAYGQDQVDRRVAARKAGARNRVVALGLIAIAAVAGCGAPPRESPTPHDLVATNGMNRLVVVDAAVAGSDSKLLELADFYLDQAPGGTGGRAVALHVWTDRSDVPATLLDMSPDQAAARRATVWVNESTRLRRVDRVAPVR